METHNNACVTAPRRSFSPAEFAQVNGYSKAYIYGAIRDGKLRAYRTGGDGPVRVLAEDGDLFLRGQRTSSDEPAAGVAPAKAAQRAANRRGGHVAKQARRARKRGA